MIAVLYNSLAGAGASVAMTDRISEYLKQRSTPFMTFDSQWPQDLSQYNEAWIVGGDGTVNHFVNQYPNATIPLVIFNGGTGNDVHWLLYGKITFEEQLQLVFAAEPRPVDLATCNDRYFLNGTGIGFEGAVAVDLAGKKKRPGKTSFLIAILKRIFFYSSQRYKTVSPEMSTDGKYLIIDVANGQRAGGGFHIAPNSAIDDGLLDVVLVNNLHPIMRLRYLPVIEKGKHLGLAFIRHYKTSELTIESDKEMLAHLDGEVYTAKKMVFGILPGQLRIKY